MKSKEKARPEGWVLMGFEMKSHYLRERRPRGPFDLYYRSLCGLWNTCYMRPDPMHDDDAPDNCKLCQRKRKAEKAARS